MAYTPVNGYRTDSRNAAPGCSAGCTSTQRNLRQEVGSEAAVGPAGLHDDLGTELAVLERTD